MPATCSHLQKVLLRDLDLTRRRDLLLVSSRRTGGGSGRCIAIGAQLTTLDWSVGIFDEDPELLDHARIIIIHVFE